MKITATGLPKNVAKYVTTRLPKTPKLYPKRYRVYEQYCANPEIASLGITMDKGPLLSVISAADLKKKGKKASLLGVFFPTIPNQIFISESCANKYEKSPVKYGIGLQYLLLHELIHWARHQAQVTSGVYSMSSLGVCLTEGESRCWEAGDMFERDAYGKDMSHVWVAGADKGDWDAPL